jgi:hypothetical protein
MKNLLPSDVNVFTEPLHRNGPGMSAHLAAVGYQWLYTLQYIDLKSSIFWDTRSCSSLKVNQSFGTTCRLNIQDQRKIQARDQHEAGDKQYFFLDSCLACLPMEDKKGEIDVSRMSQHEILTVVVQFLI